MVFLKVSQIEIEEFYMIKLSRLSIKVSSIQLLLIFKIRRLIESLRLEDISFQNFIIIFMRLKEVLNFNTNNKHSI